MPFLDADGVELQVGDLIRRVAFNCGLTFHEDTVFRVIGLHRAGEDCVRFEYVSGPPCSVRSGEVGWWCCLFRKVPSRATKIIKPHVPRYAKTREYTKNAR